MIARRRRSPGPAVTVEPSAEIVSPSARSRVPVDEAAARLKGPVAGSPPRQSYVNSDGMPTFERSLRDFPGSLFALHFAPSNRT